MRYSLRTTGHNDIKALHHLPDLDTFAPPKGESDDRGLFLWAAGGLAASGGADWPGARGLRLESTLLSRIGERDPAPSSSAGRLKQHDRT